MAATAGREGHILEYALDALEHALSKAAPWTLPNATGRLMVRELQWTQKAKRNHLSQKRAAARESITQICAVEFQQSPDALKKRDGTRDCQFAIDDDQTRPSSLRHSSLNARKGSNVWPSMRWRSSGSVLLGVK